MQLIQPISSAIKRQTVCDYRILLFWLNGHDRYLMIPLKGYKHIPTNQINDQQNTVVGVGDSGGVDNPISLAT